MSSLAVSVRLASSGGGAYMRMLHHDPNLSADPIQPFLPLKPPALLACCPWRFEKYLAGIDGASAHVDDSVHLSKRALPQRLFVDVHGTLSRSAGLTGCHLGRVVVDAQPAEKWIGGLTVLEELSHILLILGFARLVAGELDFEYEPPDVNLDLPCLPVCTLQVQYPGEVVAHFLFRLPAVTDGGSVRRRIPQHKVSFPTDDIERDVKMDSAGVPDAPWRQQDVTFLLVGTEGESFGRIFWRLVSEVQPEAISVFLVIIVFIVHL